MVVGEQDFLTLKLTRLDNLYYKWVQGYCDVYVLLYNIQCQFAEDLLCADEGSAIHTAILKRLKEYGKPFAKHFELCCQEFNRHD